jgi:hypothetical protein
VSLSQTKSIDRAPLSRAPLGVRSLSVRSTIALAVAVLLSAAAVLAQSAPLVIRGRVLASDNDRPLRRALVTLTGTRPVLTDDEGRFAIEAADRSVSFTVSKAGYASIRFTPPRPPTANRAFVVRIARGGVISGRIMDSNGEPAVGSTVIARLDGPSSGNALTTFEAEADDLGEYRISGLPEGRYAVSLTLTGSRILTAEDYDRMMALTKQGQRLQELLMQQPVGRSRIVDVRAGEEFAGLDFDIDAIRTFRSLAPILPQMPITGPIQGQPDPGRPGGPPAIVMGTPLPALNGGRVLSVLNGSPRSLDIQLSGGGAVSGTVVDAAGEPFQGVAVRALRVHHAHGRTVARSAGWERVTDDRGRYRLFGLSPGSYLIVARLDATETTSATSTTGLASMYFPGANHIAAAQPLLIEIGSVLTGVDLTFASTPIVRVAGRALDAIGHRLVGRVLLTPSQRSGTIGSEPRVARTNDDGTFEFIDVTPGDYVLQAIADAGFGGPAEFGSEYVTVTDQDPPPVVISTSRGATLEGRFVVEGGLDPPMRPATRPMTTPQHSTQYSLHATAVDLDRSPSGGRGAFPLAIHDDGRFYIRGLHGSLRLTVPETLPGWYLKSLTIGGVDVTDRPFDFGHEEATVPDAQVVLSDSGAGITGAIQYPQDARRVTATVIAFSTNRDMWFDGSRHVKRTSSAMNGRFDVAGLPPGDYFVAAIDAATPLDLQAPDTLESLVSRAARVTAREGVVSEVTLGLVRR